MKKTISALIIGLVCATNSTLVNAEDLLSVYKQAQASDPTVLKLQALFNASKEDIDQARSVLLPTLNAEVGYSQGASYGESSKGDKDGNFKNERLKSSDYSGTDYRFTFGMELYKHSSWLRLDNAKKSAHRSDVSYQSAKQELIVRVTTAYFDVLSAKDDLDFAKAEKAAIERQLEQTKQRYSVGLKAVTDVHEAQSQYDNAVTSEIRAENSVFTAEEALRVITNVYPRDLNILNTERFSTSRPVPDSANEWQQTAEAKNLDLISQKIAVDIAKENINIATSGHYPSLSLGGSYGGSSDDNQMDNSSSKSDDHSIGITLKVPIYSGGAITSAVRQAQSNYVAASQDLEETHRDVVRQTRNAYNTVIAAVSAIKALEQALVSAESALKATDAGFEVGTRTIVDVLDSTRNLYNAKRNLSSTRYNYVQSILSLKRAAGTISEQDLVNINKGLIEAK
jgi:outer membrane protein